MPTCFLSLLVFQVHLYIISLSIHSVFLLGNYFYLFIFLINNFLNFFWIQSLICPYFYLETSSYFLLLLLGFMCQIKTHNLELIILTCHVRHGSNFHTT